MQIGLDEICQEKTDIRAKPRGLYVFDSLPRGSISPSVKWGVIRAPSTECHGDHLHQSPGLGNPSKPGLAIIPQQAN